MSIKTPTIAGLLSSGLLLSAVTPSFAAPVTASDAYQDAVVKLQQELKTNPSISSSEHEQIDINSQMATWLHQQGKDAQALEYINLAIWDAGLPS